MKPKNENPIINCHTHTFIGKSVPPYLAKTFLPFPLYYIFTIPLIVGICRFWYTNKKSPYQWQFQDWYKNLQKAFYFYRMLLYRSFVVGKLITILNLIIAYHAILYIAFWMEGILWNSNIKKDGYLYDLKLWLVSHHLIYLPKTPFLAIIVILFAFFFISNSRKLIIFLLKKMVSALGVLPDTSTLTFLKRYINIGRFAYYKEQSRIFSSLKGQYEPTTGFVVLPMDMEFMEAGKPKAEGEFAKQMADLHHLKTTNKTTPVYPFVFIDPRREKVDQKDFLKWTATNGTVTLGDCFVKEYIEGHGFNGFKIYPALGYYPFDTKLLPLWKYAADNQLPITTHCIRGTIFYRGSKKKEWDFHPIFEQINNKKVVSPLFLPEQKNIDFINNFTHPLNYLCLLEETLLRKVIAKCEDNSVKTLFGFTDLNTPLLYNLDHLKLCFGHYGGDDEWKKFFEKDRYHYANQVITNPKRGINFLDFKDPNDLVDNLERIWKHVDWYSIITSIMLQKDHIYSDISYTVHENSIFSLLKRTLNQDKLKDRVLYGTDFYVVRNHKSEKEIVMDLQAALTEEEFNLIARENPREFLNI